MNSTIDHPDYLVLGHLTHDRLPDGSSTAGGTVLYAGLTAQRLGMRTAVFTAAAAVPAQLIELDYVHLLASKSTTTFENRYAEDGRSQWLHTLAPPLDMRQLPPSWLTAPVVHFGPLVNEFSLDLLHTFPHALIGVTPQGWMRMWQDPLPATVHRISWLPPPDLLQRIGLLVLSIEDLGGDDRLARVYARACRLVALTRGAQGATLFIEGEPHQLAAFSAQERDPTGAGDVFTAAMLVALARGQTPLDAARFAAATAALAVEGAGTSCIPVLDTVLARIRR